MLNGLIRWNHSGTILIYLLMVFASSCVQKDIYEGVYKALKAENSIYGGSQLELMEKGRAVWRVPDDEVSAPEAPIAVFRPKPKPRRRK